MIETLLMLGLALLLGIGLERWRRRRNQRLADQRALDMLCRPRVMPTIYDRFGDDLETRKRRYEP